MNDENNISSGDIRDYTTWGSGSDSFTISTSGNLVMTSLDYNTINFSQIRQFQPSNYFCTHQGELYQLWYCNYSGNKKWKRVPTSEESSIPFQEGEFN